jgi:hypothetical protein
MEIITQSSLYKGAVYPFLTGLAWLILSMGIFEDTEEEGSIGWVRSDKFSILQLRNTADGKIMNMDEALKALKLTVNPGNKTMPTVSKRLSRIMRPYFMSAFIPADRVVIQYDPELNKIMDGAGVITRKFLRSISLRLVAGLEQQKRKEMLRELKYSHRLELTIMTNRGQDKGHVYVTDEDFAFDILLPQDTKSEVKYTGDDVFIGLQPVHGRNNLWIDSQSMVNLYPFFSGQQMIAWTHEFVVDYIEAIKNGDTPRLMGTLNSIKSIEKLAEWPIREYLLSGGHPMDFAAVTMSAIRTLIKQIRDNADDQGINLPIPGMRRYLFSAAVRGLHLQAGECLIEGESIFVSNRDYIALAKTLGGADQDDSLLITQFVDHDGERKALCWRNPNQYGEYVVLNPIAQSDAQQWLGKEFYPTLDSRKLPTPIGQQQIKSLNLVQPSEALVGLPYSWDSLHKTVTVMRKNAGALGATCNLFMAQVATFGTMFTEIPDYLEKVIDSTVKTGDDVAEVLKWVTTTIRDWADNGVQVPHHIFPRVSRSLLKNQHLGFKQGAWFDRLYDGINAEIEWVRNEAEAMCRSIMPPTAIMTAGQPWTTQGAALRKLYWEIFNNEVAQYNATEEIAAERARLAILKTLAGYGELAPYIVLGALVQSYIVRNDKVMPDEWLWGKGIRVNERTEPGIGNMTVAAIRLTGHIQTPAVYGGRIHMEQADKATSPTMPAKLGYVWFNTMQDKPGKPGLVEPELAKELKQKVAETNWSGFQIEIRQENGRVLAYANDSVFAYINANTEDPVQGITRATIAAAVVQDGNLIVSLIPVAA